MDERLIDELEQLGSGALMQTRRAAEKLEHETRAELMLTDDRAITVSPEAPRFAAFAEQFVSTYAVTNNKHAEVISKRKILRVHLVPAFGDLRLDHEPPIFPMSTKWSRGGSLPRSARSRALRVA